MSSQDPVSLVTPTEAHLWTQTLLLRLGAGTVLEEALDDADDVVLAWRGRDRVPRQATLLDLLTTGPRPEGSDH